MSLLGRPSRERQWIRVRRGQHPRLELPGEPRIQTQAAWSRTCGRRLDHRNPAAYIRPSHPLVSRTSPILKLAGAFHCVKTSRIRFWAFSYSIGEPCGRSDHVSMYFIGCYVVSLMSSRNLIPIRPIRIISSFMVIWVTILPTRASAANEKWAPKSVIKDR